MKPRIKPWEQALYLVRLGYLCAQAAAKERYESDLCQIAETCDG